MRFRLGLLLGLAVGYVLGAKAGRERYVQILSAWSKVRRSEPAMQLQAEVREVAHRAGEQIEAKASEGIEKVTQMVRGGDSGNGHSS